MDRVGVQWPGWRRGEEMKKMKDKAKTMEQLRAADALKKVNDLKNNTNYNTQWKDKYASCVSSLAPAILMNGLGQAAATLCTAGEKDDQHYVLYHHLQSWLCRGNSKAPYPNYGNLMTAITDNDKDDYFIAQAEALVWLQWLKKFATAYLKTQGGDS